RYPHRRDGPYFAEPFYGFGAGDSRRVSVRRFSAFLKFDPADDYRGVPRHYGFSQYTAVDFEFVPGHDGARLCPVEPVQIRFQRLRILGKNPITDFWLPQRFFERLDQRRGPDTGNLSLQSQIGKAKFRKIDRDDFCD